MVSFFSHFKPCRGRPPQNKQQAPAVGYLGRGGCYIIIVKIHRLFKGKFLFVEKWAFNVFVDWQVRLRETNYQQVIFDKSFCGELQKIADYIIFNNLLY